MQEIENIQDIYNDLVNCYSKGMQQQDAKTLTEFVRNGQVLLFKDEAHVEQYVSLRIMRGDAYDLFGKFTEAIKEYRLALIMCPPNEQWEVYLAWCQTLFHQFMASTEKEQLLKLPMQIIEIAQKGKKTIISGKDTEYRRMTFAHFEAFFHLYNGQTKAARACYNGFKFKPVPIPQYNNEQELSYLMSNYAKGLAVAIELEDKTLLHQLLKVISIDDQTLYEEKNIFKMFHTTLLNTMDTRSEFATDLNKLFIITDKVRSEMKQLAYFLTSTQANMLLTLDGFFNNFK